MGVPGWSGCGRLLVERKGDLMRMGLYWLSCMEGVKGMGVDFLWIHWKVDSVMRAVGSFCCRRM